MAPQQDPTSHQQYLRELLPPPSLRSKVFIEQGLISAFRMIIYKLLAFTVAMVVVPIGSYFATVDLLFRGKPRQDLAGKNITLLILCNRQRHLCRRFGSCHGKRRFTGLRYSCHEGRSKREDRGGAESEEGSVTKAEIASPTSHSLSVPHM